MAFASHPRLVAIVGGSGSGKSWLVKELQRVFGAAVVPLCVDSFYRDLAPLPLAERAGVNFDEPAAIDWTLLGEVLTRLRQGLPSEIPVYDYATHTRKAARAWLTPAKVVLLDGLWLPPNPQTRALLDLSVFVDCPEQKRLARRVQRDRQERGRTLESVERQWTETVQLMHQRHVEPQRHQTDVVIASPPDPATLEDLIQRVLAFFAPPKTA